MGCLDGKVAVVTGSGQGIGRGIAIGLAREGAKVITNNRKPGGLSSQAYDKDAMPTEDYEQMASLAGDAESTVEFIKAEGGEALACYGDVANEADANKLIQTAIDTWGRIDVVVNNAAGMGTGGITQISDDDWDKMTVTKMKGAFHTMKAAVPHMVEQGFGRIFNGSSDAWIGLPGNDAYSAGNAGIVGLTYAAAKELFRFGITVNAYCPQGQSPAHAVEYNKMLRHVKEMTGKDPDPNLLAVVEANHGDPVNLGPVLAYLSTEEAGYISGEVFALTSSGKIDRYVYPHTVSHAEPAPEAGYLWDVADLSGVFKDTVMGADYESHASKQAWS